MRSEENKESTAILTVSFGAAGEQGLAAIRAVEDSLAEAFPGFGVRRAFTSGIMIRKLKAQAGKTVDDVAEALERLLSDGVENVVIQPTYMTKGYEYDRLRETAAFYEPRFSSVRYGAPLLSSGEDCRKMARILAEEAGNCGCGDTAVVYMGHGTSHGENAAYAELSSCLREAGYFNYYIGTMEASPTLEDVLRKVGSGGYRRVLLLPLLLTAGGHALRDMAGETEDSWKNRFQAAGYETECILKGLGEYPGVQRLFADHVRESLLKNL